MRNKSRKPEGGRTEIRTEIGRKYNYQDHDRKQKKPDKHRNFIEEIIETKGKEEWRREKIQ